MDLDKTNSELETTTELETDTDVIDVDSGDDLDVYESSDSDLDENDEILHKDSYKLDPTQTKEGSNLFKLAYRVIKEDETVIKVVSDKTKQRIPLKLSLFAATEAVSIRAEQINDGSLPPMIESKYGNCINIARDEFNQKKNPLRIRFDIGNNKFEIYNIRDMVLPYLEILEDLEG